MRAPLVALLLVGLAFAGCVTPPGPAPETGASDPLLATLRAAPAPALDGPGVLDWLASFVGAHSPRLTGTPGEKAAGEDMAQQLEAMGYDVETKLYNARGLPSVDGPLRVVTGTKTGLTEPKRIVVLGAHYDTTAALTLEAAYDNGSGTAMVMELARLMADVATNKTIVFALFNGEEEGLLASAAYADDLASQGATVEAYMGYDMVGINYPSHAGCLCIYAGTAASAELNPLQETVAFDLLELPRGDDTVQVFDNHDTRNSDEASFASAGFRTMRWAGMASAGDYWAYHQVNDTIETMVAQAGSEELLAEGIENVAATSYYTLLAVDATAVFEARP